MWWLRIDGRAPFVAGAPTSSFYVRVATTQNRYNDVCFPQKWTYQGLCMFFDESDIPSEITLDKPPPVPISPHSSLSHVNPSQFT